MAKAVTPEQGAKFQMGKGDSRYLVSSEIGAHQISMNFSVFQPGHEFPQHFHDLSADIFIVLEGGVSVRQGDHYTPITAGSFAYIPPGEVHGTINQTDKQAILISFQSPPDVVMYRGERDPAVTGSVPKPPPNHISQVQIKQLASDEGNAARHIRQWMPALSGDGKREMQLQYYQLEPGGKLAMSAAQQAETVWFVWSGAVVLTANGEHLPLGKFGAAFVPAGEEQTLKNVDSEPAHLIRCQAPPE